MEITDLQNQARKYFDRDSFTEAATLYRDCIEIEPDNINNYWYLGLALLLSGEESDAQDVWMSVLLNSPTEEVEENSSALKSFLRIEADRFYASQKLQQAESIYLQILELDSDSPEIYCNLGIILGGLKRVKEASDCFKKAIDLNPNSPLAWRALADSFMSQDKPIEAIECYEKAIELGLYNSETFTYLGMALRLVGNYQAAISRYQEALEIEPKAGIKIKQALALPIIATSTAKLDRARQEFEERIDALLSESLTLSEPVNEVEMTHFYLAYQGKNDRKLVRKLSELYEQACPSLLWTAPHCQQASLKTDSRKIKIGFLSSYFCNHTIGKLNRGLIARLSRDLFSVFVFCTPQLSNPYTEFFQQHADEFIVIESKLEKAREVIAKYELDILFYTDIGMNYFTYFLAFARLAPIQCVTWGHPVTTGIKNIDYFFSSKELETTNVKEHYSEEPILLNNLNTYYYKPQPPQNLKSRSDFNLDREHHLYICPQSLFKFHPEFDGIMSDILRADSLGKIVLIQGSWASWEKILMTRLRQTMSDVVDRIIMLPRLSESDFFNILLLADVMIDPIHFGGGNTSYEAFAFGVPVVTWPGEYLRSRITYACYKQMGFTECVAHNQNEYVQIALRLGNDPSYRHWVSQQIIARHDLLFENKTVVREMEECFLQLVRQKSDRP